MHCGSLQHLVWLGLQWHSMSVLFPLRKLLKQLFHLPQETSRLETDAPESICLLDLEVSKRSKLLSAFKCRVFFLVPNTFCWFIFTKPGFFTRDGVHLQLTIAREVYYSRWHTSASFLTVAAVQTVLY